GLGAPPRPGFRRLHPGLYSPRQNTSPALGGFMVWGIEPRVESSEPGAESCHIWRRTVDEGGEGPMPDITPDSAETRALLEAVRAGDAEALGKLLDRPRPALRDFVEVHLDPRIRARVDPSDVVQETQVELVRRLDDFLAKRPMPFRLWVRKKAHERLLNLRR